MAYNTPTMPDDEPAAKLDKTEVLREFRLRFKQSQQHSQDWRDEARTLYDLKAGHQWSTEDEERLAEKYQGTYPSVTFNVTDKYMDAVGGLQINNRQEIRYYPREAGDAGVDDFATGVVKWNRDQCEAEDEETDAFGDVFLTGMAWVEHFLDDTEDPDGFIGQERRDPIEMYWDPMARRKNLTDRKYQIRIRPMSAQEAAEFFGEDEIENLENVGSEFGNDDSSPQIISIPHDYGDSQPGSESPKPIYVADYQFCRLKKTWRVKAQFAGQPPMEQEFTDAEWKETKPALERTMVPFEAEHFQKKCYYRCWIAGDKIKGDIKELKIGGFTFEAITGKRDRNTNTWYGMGRGLKDPQCWTNKFFSSILYTISVNAKGGLMAEESAFADQRKAEQSWSDPAAITFTEDGAISQGKIQPKPPAPYPAGMDKLMHFTLEVLPLISGMNPELLGLADRDQPGVLEAQRKQSAMAIIAWVFSAMRLYYRRSGKLMLSMIREYIPDGRLIRITGKKGEQYVPLIKDRLTRTFDIVVDESPTSVNMQERTWAILERMIPMAQTMGWPIPPNVVEYAPIPGALAQDWRKAMQPKPPSPQEVKMKQTQERAINAEIAKDESAAMLNKAKAQEAMVDARVKAQGAPISDALKQVQAVKVAAEAGIAQAGGV